MKVCLNFPDEFDTFVPTVPAKGPENQMANWIFQTHWKIVKDLREWCEQNNIDFTKPELKWQRSIDIYMVKSAIGLEMTEEQALMFHLRFT